MNSRILLFMCLALWLVGCRSRTVYVPMESRTDSVFIEKLIPYSVPGDSASIRALLECDEKGKVILRWLDLSNSENVSLKFRLDSLGNLNAEMITTTDTIYIPSKNAKVSKETKVPYPVEKKLTRWQQIKMDAGGYAISLLVIAGIIGLSYCVRWLIRPKR